MRDSSDITSSFELIPQTEMPREEDDDIPSFYKTMFTSGVVGGFLRLPVLCLLLFALLSWFQLGMGSRGSGPVVPVLVIAMLATAAMAGLGVGANFALLNQRRQAVSMGYGALGLAVLLYLFWVYVLGAIGAASLFGAFLFVLLLVRLAFLIAYAVALHRYRQWLRWGWY